MKASEVLRRPLVRGIITFITGLAAIIWVVSVYGCAMHSAKYSGLDAQNKPFTIELEASRFVMGQEVTGFSASFPGGYKVGFDNSKSDPVKTMEAFFQVLGPIMQDYMKRQQP